MLDDIIQLKNVFDKYDTLKQTVEDEDKRLKGAK